MKRLKKLITRNLQGRKILLLFILTNVIYFAMILVTIPKLSFLAGGMKILDVKPLGYSDDYVKGLMAALGEEGRRVYLWEQIPLDLVYPLLFGVSYCLLQAFVLKKLEKLNTIYFTLCFLPLLAGIADYFENLGIIFLLKRYPNLNNFSIYWTQIFSLVKIILSTFFFLGLIISLIAWALRSFKNGRFSSQNISDPKP